MFYVRIFISLQYQNDSFIRSRRSRSIFVDKGTSNMELQKTNTKVEACQSCKQKTITPTNCTTVHRCRKLETHILTKLWVALLWSPYGLRGQRQWLVFALQAVCHRRVGLRPRRAAGASVTSLTLSVTRTLFLLTLLFLLTTT